MKHIISFHLDFKIIRASIRSQTIYVGSIVASICSESPLTFYACVRKIESR